MPSKLYSTAKKIIKENIVYMSIGVLLVLIFNIPLPYQIETYGDLINVEDKVIVKDGYNSKGSFNLTYVSEIKGNVFTYLVAKLNKNWDLNRIDESSVENENHMDKILLENSLDTAMYIAYKSLNKNINVIDTKLIVLYLDENSNTNLEIGDIINKVDNKYVYSLEDYSDIVKNSKKGEVLKIITSDNKERYVEIKEFNGPNSTLIYLICDYDYDVKDVTFKFNKGESGPSGGLMIALSIYDQLTDNDLTKGRIIAGTGTVNRDGNVGGISGIKYKLKGAVKNKADIFLVPKSNYSEAIKEIEENNYNIKLVSIEKFTDALKYLSEK